MISLGEALASYSVTSDFWSEGHEDALELAIQKALEAPAKVLDASSSSTEIDRRPRVERRGLDHHSEVCRPKPTMILPRSAAFARSSRDGLLAFVKEHKA